MSFSKLQAMIQLNKNVKAQELENEKLFSQIYNENAEKALEKIHSYINKLFDILPTCFSLNVFINIGENKDYCIYLCHQSQDYPVYGSSSSIKTMIERRAILKTTYRHYSLIPLDQADKSYVHSLLDNDSVDLLDLLIKNFDRFSRQIETAIYTEFEKRSQSSYQRMLSHTEKATNLINFTKEETF